MFGGLPQKNKGLVECWTVKSRSEMATSRRVMPFQEARREIPSECIWFGFPWACSTRSNAHICIWLRKGLCSFQCGFSKPAWTIPRAQYAIPNGYSIRCFQAVVCLQEEVNFSFRFHAQSFQNGPVPHLDLVHFTALITSNKLFFVFFPNP